MAVKTVADKKVSSIYINSVLLSLALIGFILTMVTFESASLYYIDLSFEYDDAYWTQLIPALHFFAVVWIFGSYMWQKVKTLWILFKT
jgi:hypothetical protein